MTSCGALLYILTKYFTMSREHGGFMPDVLCSLYSVMVQPVIEYGCEIWGVKQFHVYDGKGPPELCVRPSS